MLLALVADVPDAVRDTDPKYPVVELERYEEPSILMGIETTDKGMESRYGVVLNLELVPEGEKSGSGKEWPIQPVYFKVLPKGFSDFKGLLLGFPTLDHKARGMGLQVTEHTHWFSAKDVHMPRIEKERRKQRDKEMESWHETGDYVSLVTCVNLQQTEGSKLITADLRLPWVLAMWLSSQ